ncbi:zinc metalloproteinase nas-39-like [Ornithodoros turicata]|uniref:zinc metalloproteinase nas-39-like n=1 Tax=Ornithodoros turicata TaxID=34597 RepID=UPI0031387FED
MMQMSSMSSAPEMQASCSTHDPLRKITAPQYPRPKKTSITVILVALFLGMIAAAIFLMVGSGGSKVADVDPLDPSAEGQEGRYDVDRESNASGGANRSTRATTLVFVTTTATTTEGATVTATEEAFVSPCNTTLSGRSGEFVSLNYPGFYASNLNQTWCIKTSAYCQVHLKFLDFQLEDHPECQYDNVTVYDGGSDNATRIACLCNEKPFEVTSTGNLMYVWFQTDSKRQFRGFRAQYIAVNCHKLLAVASRSLRQERIKKRRKKFWLINGRGRPGPNARSLGVARWRQRQVELI